MSGPLSVLFGFLSTLSKKKMANRMYPVSYWPLIGFKNGPQHLRQLFFFLDALKVQIARVVKMDEGKYRDRSGKRGMDICNAWSLPQQVKNNRQLYHSH